jgi:hypothetical protein
LPLAARVPPGRQGEAPIRKPGDLPSAVSTRQTSVGVYRWMIQKTKVFWSSLAPATGGKLRQSLAQSHLHQVTRGLFLVQFPEIGRR